MRVNGFIQRVLVLLGFKILGLSAYSLQSVQIPPSDSRVVVYKSDRAILDCPLNASRVTKYEWTKDGTALDLSRRIQLYSNGSLVIEKARSRRKDGKNDSGLYECYVQTEFGTVLGRQVEFKVIRQTLSIEPGELTVKLGGTARFECRTNDEGDNQPSYVWEHPPGNNYVFDNPRIYTYRGVIQIHNVTSADEGLYICKMFPRISANMKTLEKSAFLKISSGPSAASPIVPAIVNTPLHVSAAAGQPALIECLADGSTGANITWTYPEGSPGPGIGDGRVNVSHHSNIRFSYTVTKDSGIYMCTVRHSGNQIIQRKYQLDITTPPEIEKRPVYVIKNPLAQRSRITCTPKGNPKPSVRWYKDGRKIYPEDHVGEELILYGRLDDNGYYQCVVSNKLGSTIATTWVQYTKIPNTPKKVTNVVAVPISSSKVKLSWSPTAVLDKVLAYTIDSYPVHEEPCPDHCVCLNDIEKEASRPAIKVIEGLRPYTLYTFEVQAVSAAGVGTLSDPVTVRTLEAVPSSTPEIQISPDSVTSFRVTWSEIPESDRNGIINRHQLSYGTKQRLAYIEVSGDTYHYLVTNMMPDTEYKVQVLSGNSAGYPKGGEHWLYYKTPRADEEEYEPDPELTFQPLNATSVLVEWNGEDFQNVGKYRITVQYLLISGPVKEYNISANQNSFVITGLDNRIFYQLDFMVKNPQGRALRMVTETYQAHAPDDAPEPPPPVTVDPVPQSDSVINLTWSRPKTSLHIQLYRVRFQRRLGDKPTGEPVFIQSTTEVATLSDLQAFTWYLIAIQSITATTSGPFSKPVIVQTKEGIPSPPENLYAEVVSPGKVQLKWSPPRQQNGIITNYIIYYNQESDQPKGGWSSMEQNASTTSVLVDNLQSKVYYFKLQACTNAGRGKFTHVTMIKMVGCDGKPCPSCEPSQTCPTNEGSKDGALTRGFHPTIVIIIVGCIVLVFCICCIVLLVIIRKRQLRDRHRPPNGPAQGVMMVTQNPTGHQLSQYQRQKYEASYSPLLRKMIENKDCDTKGEGYDMYLTEVGSQGNTVLCNGNQNKLFLNGGKLTTEQSTLLSPSSSSSHGNDTSSEPTNYTVESSFTTPDSIEEDGPCQKIQQITSSHDVGATACALEAEEQSEHIPSADSHDRDCEASGPSDKFGESSGPTETDCGFAAKHYDSAELGTNLT